MRIGVDFDNTIAGYDRLFARLAVEEGLLPASPGGGKRAVRDGLRARPGGEAAWQRLQGLAYGARMAEAELIAGAAGFLERCRRAGVPVHVVSHKTRHSAFDPQRVDLRRAALGWMEAHGFFRPDGLGLDREQVFFEETRAAKIARIRALGCSHFIDDLEEVFAEPSFPRDVAAILYDPGGQAANGNGGAYRSFADWRQITEHVLGTLN